MNIPADGEFVLNLELKSDWSSVQRYPAGAPEPPSRPARVGGEDLIVVYNARVFPRLLCTVLAFAFLLVTCEGSEAKRSVPRNSSFNLQDRPNIVFLLTDDQPIGSLPSMPAVQNRLAAKGRVFTNYLANYPLCCPARATLQTGLLAHNTRVFENDPPHGGYGRFVKEGHEQHTAATWLRAAGYNTAYLGRYMHGFTGSSLPPGWDRFNASIQDGPKSGQYVNREGRIAPLPVPPGGTRDSVIAGRAEGLVREWAPREKPFFMQVGFEAPHAPAPSEERYRGSFSGERVPRTPDWNEADVSDKPRWVREKPPLEAQRMPESGAYCRSKYDDSVRQGDCLWRNQLESLQTVDKAVAKIIKTLAEAGDLDDTWIFLTSDQGLHLGQHRLDYGKLTAYETDTAFPLLVRGPGVPEGSESARLAGNHDLASTFANIARAEASRETDGRSLVPALTGDPEDWRTALYSEHRVFEDDPPREGGPQDVPAWEAVRTERYSYIEYANGDRELYDLEADPYQLGNLLHKPTPEAEATASELSKRLTALKTCSGDVCRMAEGP